MATEERDVIVNLRLQAEEYNRGLRTANEQTERLERTMADVVAEMRRAREATAAHRAATEQQRQAQRAAAEAARQQARAQAEANQRMREAEQRAEKLKSTLSMLSVGAGVWSAAMVAAAAVCVKQLGQFEATLNTIRAVSGATAGEMEKMRAVALKLGADTKLSATEAANGMAELAKAGFNAQQAIAAIPGVLALAGAGALGVADAAEIAGSALNGFKLGAESAGLVADLLAKAANVSAISVQDLGESFKYIAPIAASTSQSIQEVSTALAIMGNQGIKGSQGGTVLRAALAQLAKPSKEAADLLHQLGIRAEQANGKMAPLTNIIGQLRTATASMTETQRANAMATIFGTEAMSGILAIMGQTEEQVAAVAGQFRDVTGEAEAMAGIMNSGLNGAIEELNGSLDTLKILLGEQVAPAIMASADALKALLNAASSTSEGTKTVAAGAAAAAIAFTGLGAAAGAAGLGIAGLRVALAGTALTLGPLVGGLAVLSVAIGGLVMAAKYAHDAQTQQARAAREVIETNAKAVTENVGLKRSLESLVTEHDALISKKRLTQAETQRLGVLTETLKKQFPQLAGAVDKAGRSHWAALPAIRAQTQEYMRLTAAAMQALRAQLAQARQKQREAVFDRDAARMQEYAASQRLRGVPPGSSPFVGMGWANVIDATNSQSQVKAAEQKVQDASKAIAALEAQIKDLETVINPPPLPEIKLGGVVAPGTDPKAASGRAARSAAAAARRAATEAKRREQAQVKLEESKVQLLEQKAARDLDMNENVWKAGPAKALAIYEDLIAKLKQLPKDHGQAAAAIKRAEDELAKARVKAAELWTQKRKEAEAKAAKEAEERAAAERKRVEADNAVKLAQLEVWANAERAAAEEAGEEAAVANDEKREAIERAYKQGRITTEEYYTELARLRESDLRAAAAVEQRKLELAIASVNGRIAAEKRKAEADQDPATLLRLEGEKAALEQQLTTLPAKTQAAVERGYADAGNKINDHTYQQTRSAVERALEGAFTGDWDSLLEPFQDNFTDAIVDALGDSKVGGMLKDVMGGAGAGGWKLALIAGFVDLIVGSFRDLGVEGMRRLEHQRTLNDALYDDPVADARNRVGDMRERMFKSREKTTKFLGLIPMGYTPGFLTPEEEQKLAALEAQEVAKAQAEVAEKAEAKRKAAMQERMEQLEAEIALGRKGYEDQVAFIEGLLATEQLGYQERMNLEIRLQDLKRDHADEERRWALEKAQVVSSEAIADVEAAMGAYGLTPDQVGELRAQKRALQEEEIRGREAAIAKIEEEMALLDASSARYRDLWRERQGLSAANAGTRRSWIAEDAQAFEDQWRQAMDGAAKAFEEMSARAVAALEAIEVEGERSNLQAKNYRDYAAARGWTSQFQNQVQTYMDEIALVKRLRTEFQRQDNEANRMLGSVNDFLNNLYLNGGQKVGYTTDFDYLSRLMASNGGYLRNSSGDFVWSSSLSNVKANYDASMAIRNQAPSKYAEFDRRESAAWSQLDLLKATGESVVDALLDDMAIELQSLRAGDDPAAQKAAERARIEAEFAKRRQDLYDQGLIDIYGKADNTLVDQRLQDQLAQKLDELKNAQLAALDKQDEASKNRPTVANPLPVRVVEMPPTYALPASAYFRGQGTIVRFERGAIAVNGSGLNEAQQAAAIQAAIERATPTITRNVNRENTINDSQLRLG